MSSASGAARLGRLRWLCRRGMKELDVLLERFIQHNGQALQTGDWPEFESLLAQEDDLLWDWFQGREEPDSPALIDLIHIIRDEQ